MTNPSPSSAFASVALGPLRIEIGGPGSATYKSIDELVWEDIPPFAVLTGLNGSGKSQLLELLAFKLTDTYHPQMEHVTVTVTGDNFGPDSVAYLPVRWDLAGTALGMYQMHDAKQQLYNQLRQATNIRGDMVQRSKRARLEKFLGNSLDQTDIATFLAKVPDDFVFMLDDADVTSGLAHVFLAYRLSMAEELERNTPRADIASKIGPAPWDVLNETLQTAEFPYRVVSPLESKILETYILQLKDVQSGQTVNTGDLSSGEKALFALVLWLYNSKHHGRFPRLFLLDEPDAYLHPSMAGHFLDVIKEVLVDRYKVRVILITHSPSTVALAPEDSLFEMSRTKPRISASKSRADTIGLLTAGLVIVSPGTRYVLVEEDDDVTFYNAVRDILSDYGPSRDPRAIKPSPTLVFMPASVGTGKGKIAGGSSVVIHWIDKFDQAPLDEIFRGVIDRDTNNLATTRIQVLKRYSIENYMLDPFIVFALLLDQGTAPTIPTLPVSQGDEQRIRTLDQPLLQQIVEAISSKVEPAITNLTAAERNLQPVTFTNGRTVQYPGWMIDRRGHDLLPVYQSVLGGAGVISPPRLFRSLRRVRMIPTELADVMDTLQG